MDDHTRSTVAKACAGATGVTAVGGLTLVGFAAAKDSTFPWWPAILAAVVCGLAIIGWMLAAFKIGPFRPPGVAPADGPVQQEPRGGEHTAGTSSCAPASQRLLTARQQAKDQWAIEAAHKENERQRRVILRLHKEWLADHPDASAAMKLGLDPLPKEWVDRRLGEMGEGWREDRYLPDPDQ